MSTRRVLLSSYYPVEGGVPGSIVDIPEAAAIEVVKDGGGKFVDEESNGDSDASHDPEQAEEFDRGSSGDEKPVRKVAKGKPAKSE